MRVVQARPARDGRWASPTRPCSSTRWAPPRVAQRSACGGRVSITSSIHGPRNPRRPTWSRRRCSRTAPPTPRSTRRWHCFSARRRRRDGSRAARSRGRSRERRRRPEAPRVTTRRDLVQAWFRSLSDGANARVVDEVNKTIWFGGPADGWALILDLVAAAPGRRELDLVGAGPIEEFLPKHGAVWIETIERDAAR